MRGVQIYAMGGQDGDDVSAHERRLTGGAVCSLSLQQASQVKKT